VTLAAWPEQRVIGAMRGWRRGCRVLLPWFRATPFASAFHYRERTLAVRGVGAAPSDVTRLVGTLVPPDPATLTVVDLPGASALWLAYLLRRRHRMAVALGLNGWYDPEGCLDGRREIPLLLTLGERLRRTGARLETAIVFDRDRLQPSAPAPRLDNRYRIGDEDLPALEQLQAAGWRRVRLLTSGEPAPDLAGWLCGLGSQMAVEILANAEVAAA